MRHYYLVVSEDFVKEHSGYQNENGIIGFATTSDGRHVTSVNTLNEFQELFEKEELSAPVALDREEDFPQPQERK